MDKYAQPNVGFDGPAMTGAENVVLPNLDHRELAFQPVAFAEMCRFITGSSPKVMEPAPEIAPRVAGLVTGTVAGAPTNRPLAGVHLRVFLIKKDSADREGAAVLDQTTAESGAWGPLSVNPEREYEFSLEKDGRTTDYFMARLCALDGLAQLSLFGCGSGRQTAGIDSASAAGLFLARPRSRNRRWKGSEGHSGGRTGERLGEYSGSGSERSTGPASWRNSLRTPGVDCD